MFGSVMVTLAKITCKVYVLLIFVGYVMLGISQVGEGSVLKVYLL